MIQAISLNQQWGERTNLGHGSTPIKAMIKAESALVLSGFFIKKSAVA
jgi:hypothetical protein